MTDRRKDVAAAVLTGAVVLLFLITWQSDLGNRWGALAITVAGICTCALGRSLARTAMVLGAVAGVLAIVSLVTGSLTVIALLVLVDVLLWATSLARHGRALPVA
ncbi:MAG: hypothetical protein ABUS54_08155 [Actinomycetota bacterium]